MAIKPWYREWAIYLKGLIPCEEVKVLKYWDEGNSTSLDVFTSRKPALARRNDGSLSLRAVLSASAGSEQGPGAAAYDAASVTGILFTLRDVATPKVLNWSIHPTGMHP